MPIDTITIICACILLGYAVSSYYLLEKKGRIRTKRDIDKDIVRLSMKTILATILFVILFMLAKFYWILVSVGNHELNPSRWIWAVIDTGMNLILIRNIWVFNELASHIKSKYSVHN